MSERAKPNSLILGCKELHEWERVGDIANGPLYPCPVCGRNWAYVAVIPGQTVQHRPLLVGHRPKPVGNDIVDLDATDLDQ